MSETAPVKKFQKVINSSTGTANTTTGSLQKDTPEDYGNSRCNIIDLNFVEDRDGEDNNVMPDKSGGICNHKGQGEGKTHHHDGAGGKGRGKSHRESAAGTSRPSKSTKGAHPSHGSSSQRKDKDKAGKHKGKGDEDPAPEVGHKSVSSDLHRLRRKEGRCLACGSERHRIADCSLAKPKDTSKRLDAPKAVAALSPCQS